jgi:hypothetical protein
LSSLTLLGLIQLAAELLKASSNPSLGLLLLLEQSEVTICGADGDRGPSAHRSRNGMMKSGRYPNQYVPKQGRGRVEGEGMNVPATVTCAAAQCEILSLMSECALPARRVFENRAFASLGSDTFSGNLERGEIDNNLRR